MQTVTATLREYVRGSPLPIHRLAREVGVAQATLWRFAERDTEIGGRSINKLAQYFGLKLRRTKPRR